MNRLLLPEDISKQLKDNSIPMVDRVALAEAYRKEHECTILGMAKNLGICEVSYKTFCRIVESNHMTLLEKIRKGDCSLNMAMRILDENVGNDSICWRNYFGYVHIQEIEHHESFEILFESRINILYRSDDGVFLRIVCGDKEKVCVVDDTPVVLNAILDLLNQEATIRWDSSVFAVQGKDGKRQGELKHHIVAAILGRPYNEMIKATVSYKRETYQDVYDLRVSNLTCPLMTRNDCAVASGGLVVTRRGKREIVIVDETRNAVYRTDYSSWLYEYLSEKRNALRLQAKDDRLCVSVGGRLEYLYHVVMAAHLYGFPTNEEDLAEKFCRFREEYLQRGKVVDHIDADVGNNCLSNLMVMTVTQNNRKRYSQAIIKDLGLPVFCWAERYDNTSIKLEAGYAHQLSSPTYKVRGVFSVEEFLDELDKFAVTVKNDGYICGEFDRLEEELNK